METVLGRRLLDVDAIGEAFPVDKGLATKENDRTGAGAVGRARMGVVGTEPAVPAQPE